VLTIALLVCWVAVLPVAAWEFRLEGGFYWKYRSFHPMGNEHLFGPHDFDTASFPAWYSAANVNFWGGINDLPNFYSGDAAVQTIYQEFYPEIRISKAVRMRSKLRVGGYNHTDYGVFTWWGDTVLPALDLPQGRSEYRPNSSRSGTDVAISDIRVTQAWLTAQLPWGALVIGKRPLSFGIGTWLNSEDTTTESVALIVPYGPLSFYMAFYPARQATDFYTDRSAWALDYWDIITLNANGDDRDFLRSPEVAVAVQYRSGPLDVGLFYEYLDWQVHPQLWTIWTDREEAVPRDFHCDWGVAYLKYNNGRFFFGSELAFMMSTVRHRMTLQGRSDINNSRYVDRVAGSGSVFQTTYTEMWRGAVETGALIGPAKLTAMWAWIPGFDRRHGIYIDRQPNALWISENAQSGQWGNRPPGMLTCHPDYSNAGFFRPYSYLMAIQYGSGVGTGNAGPLASVNGDGQMVDANVYAFRLDYAVAANLNLWVSFLKAERVSHGYGWGHLLPLTPDDFVQPVQWVVTYDNMGGWNNPSPAIPDNDLGYEIGFGMDWKLLEGLNVHSRVSIWQPGDWWKFACISRANPRWDDPSTDGSGRWGTVPNRAIDPIMGLEITLIGEF